MNTIKDPLIIQKTGTFDKYVTNKDTINQSGEYVDKALAEELLEALISARYRMNLEGNSYEMEADLDAEAQRIDKIISKHK